MERLDQNSFNAQGDCPICWWSNLDYWSAEIDDNCVSYEWTCCDCNSQWREWYTMEFYSQVVDYDWEKKMSTDDENREREAI